MILIVLDVHPAAVSDEAEQVSRVCKEVGAREVRIPETQEEMDEVWKVRKLVSPSITHIKPTIRRVAL